MKIIITALQILFIVIIFCVCVSLVSQVIENTEKDKEVTLKYSEAYLVDNDKYSELLDYIWFRESSCGNNEKCRIPGKSGEAGEYQIRPIFIAEVARITKDKFIINANDNNSCREGIAIWLDYYSEKISNWNSLPIETQYELYCRGYEGFKRMGKGKKR